MSLGVLLPQARFVLTTPEGVPIPDGKIRLYEAGTSTPVNAYTSVNLATPLPWPIEADGDGVFPAMFVDAVSLKIETYDAADVLMETTDNVVPANLMAGLIQTVQQTGHKIGNVTPPAGLIQIARGGSLTPSASDSRAIADSINPEVFGGVALSLREVQAIQALLTANLPASFSGSCNVETVNIASPSMTTLGAVPARSAGLVVTGYPSIGTERYGFLVLGPSRQGGAVQRSAVLTPAAITVNTNDYAPTGIEGTYAVRLSATGAVDLTGIYTGGTGDTPLPGSNAPGRELKLINIGANTITLKHDVTSTAAYRFLCPGSVDFSLTANTVADLWYDTTSARWRVK